MAINKTAIVKRILDLILIVAVVYAALLAFGVIRRGSQFNEGTAAPSITVKSMEDGGTVSIPDGSGKPSLLVFFSTSCPACRRELPDVQEFHKKAGDKLNVLVVSADDPASLQTYFKQEQLDLPVGIDSGRAHQVYQVSTIPYSVIIDGQGKVRADFVGGVSWSDIEPLL